MILEMLLCRVYDFLHCDKRKSRWFYTIDEYREVKCPQSRRGLLSKLFNYHYKRLEKRYLHNSGLCDQLHGEYINGQGRGAVSEMMLGENRAANVGCECIAVYNALKRDGRECRLCDIMCQVEMNHMTWLDTGGCFGVDPRRIYRYLNAHGIDYEKHGDMEKFKQAAENGKTCIMGFRIKGSHFRVHTVMLYKERGLWNVYNRYNSSQGVRGYRELEEVLDGGRFLVGYELNRKQ